MAFYADFYLFTFDAEGKQHSNYTQKRAGRSVQFDLAGAVLVELTLHNRLKLSDDGKRLEVMDSSSLDNPLLDSALYFLAGHDARGDWLLEARIAGELGEAVNPELYVRDACIAGGWIQMREERRLFGSSTSPILTNQSQRAAVYDKLRAVISQNATPDPATAMLLLYLQVCSLTDQMVTRKEETALQNATDRLFPRWMPKRGNEIGLVDLAGVAPYSQAVLSPLIIGIGSGFSSYHIPSDR
jgi:hypothetical protein